MLCLRTATTETWACVVPPGYPPGSPTSNACIFAPEMNKNVRSGSFSRSGHPYCFPRLLVCGNPCFLRRHPRFCLKCPPPCFWPQLQVCSVGDALTHSTLLGLKMCWATMPPCSATTITFAALKIFLFLSVLLRCSPDTPDRSQGYQSGQCPCTQSGRIFVFACLCVILMCLGAVGVLFVCSHACFYMFHRPWVSACP